MTELISKWDVVDKLTALENEFQQFKPFEGFEHAMYRKLCELEMEIGKTPGIAHGVTVGDKQGSTADNLSANGVTVQKLDGCEYCKEDSEGYRTMFGAFLITNPFHGNEWFINTWHCKPRKICFCPMCGRRLPQPPKGE